MKPITEARKRAREACRLDSELRQERSCLYDRVQTAEADVEVATAAADMAGSAYERGKGSEADSIAADTIRDDAKKRLERITNALAQVEEQIEQCERDENLANRETLLQVRQPAATVVAEKKARVHKLADELGQELKELIEFDALACGGFVTGDSQAERLGLAPILRKHGVEGVLMVIPPAVDLLALKALDALERAEVK